MLLRFVVPSPRGMAHQHGRAPCHQAQYPGEENQPRLHRQEARCLVQVLETGWGNIALRTWTLFSLHAVEAMVFHSKGPDTKGEHIVHAGDAAADCDEKGWPLLGLVLHLLVMLLMRTMLAVLKLHAAGLAASSALRPQHLENARVCLGPGLSSSRSRQQNKMF